MKYIFNLLTKISLFISFETSTKFYCHCQKNLVVTALPVYTMLYVFIYYTYIKAENKIQLLTVKPFYREVFVNTYGTKAKKEMIIIKDKYGVFCANISAATIHTCYDLLKPWYITMYQFPSENFIFNQKFRATSDLIKTFWKVSACDILVAGQLFAWPQTDIWFPSLLWMFVAFQILEQPTLFCVFVPFVFKLWLSGSILHLSSNLVPLTPSYHLQTCVTQKSSWIQYKYWIPSSGFNSNPKFLN